MVESHLPKLVGTLVVSGGVVETGAAVENVVGKIVGTSGGGAEKTGVAFAEEVVRIVALPSSLMVHQRIPQSSEEDAVVLQTSLILVEVRLELTYRLEDPLAEGAASSSGSEGKR
jgi:hypothetical protein